MGVVPVTSLPTLLRFGRDRRARVRFAGGEWTEFEPEDIHRYVSEAENPSNRKSVEAVEVMLPAQILRDGLCLVDTPGLGSVIKSNTEATRQFVPQIDVAVLVTGADPPITGDELDLIDMLRDRTGRLIVVLNKADLSSPAAIAESVDFTRRVIHERCGSVFEDMFVINARAHLERKEFADDFEAFVDRLTLLSALSRTEIVSAGARHGISRIAGRLLWSVDEEATMLRQPIDEAKGRIEYLDALAHSVENSIGDLRHLLLVEESRVVSFVEKDRMKFVADTVPRVRAELEDDARRSTLRGYALRAHLTRSAQDIAERHLTPWLAAEESRVGEVQRQTWSRFITLGQAFIDRLASHSGTHFGAGRLISQTPPLGASSRYQFRRFQDIAVSASPIRVVGDIVRGITGMRAGIEADAGKYLERLMAANASRIDFDLRDRLEDSRRQFEKWLLELLSDLLASARASLRRVREFHARGLPAVNERLAELENQRKELLGIVQSVSQLPGKRDALSSRE